MAHKKDEVIDVAKLEECDEKKSLLPEENKEIKIPNVTQDAVKQALKSCANKSKGSHRLNGGGSAVFTVVLVGTEVVGIKLGWGVIQIPTLVTII